jgi:hypothetical protein
MMSLYGVAVAEILFVDRILLTQKYLDKELPSHTIFEIEGCGAFLHQ